MERHRISVQIELEQRQQIEACVRREYPKLKNVSDVVRTSLKEFLEK